MIERYNPTIQTYNEQPSCEAIKAATMISRYCYWMCNQSSKQRIIDAFGPLQGEHFWNKLVHKREAEGSLDGDLGFWFEMSEGNRAKLMHYILKTGYRKQ